jgi:hypothetical protein
MKYAYEIMADVVAKKMAEEEAKRLAQLEKIAKAMENFQKHIEEIDAYVEEKLIAGNGEAELMIDNSWVSCDGFWHFAEKDYRYSDTKPYWSNKLKTEEFPLELYIGYLREHCFTVEIVEHPFTAYSSTLKSSERMKGITLKISV